jgi:itaconate CoA-transferase
MTPRSGPLVDVTVVAIEQAVAAPFATRQLADLGARVIKVERPDVGDFARGYDESVYGMSSHFVWLNRSKESAAIDLKVPTERATFERLLDGADVYVENLAPGAAKRLGLDVRTVRVSRPGLITCSISGYGSGGPMSMRKAYDLLMQCEVGLLSITGTPKEECKAGIALADIAAGMYAFSGILAALYEREKTGRGTTIEVSLLDALAEWMSYPAYFAMYSGAPPPRTGAAHATIAPYGPYRTADGTSVFLAVQNHQEWVRFCEVVLGQPQLAADRRFDTNSHRVDNRTELNPEIDRVVSTMSSELLIGMLDEARIANTTPNDLSAFLEHPQLKARHRWVNVESPVGSIRALLPPIVMDGHKSTMGAIPAVGQHTMQLQREFDLDVDDTQIQ